jgi:hypothetical protein
MGRARAPAGEWERAVHIAKFRTAAILRPRAACLLLAVIVAGLASAPVSRAEVIVAAPPAAGADNMTVDLFLDRLMRAESGGKDTARNAGSTALGPYQFIASTWLMIVNRYFKLEIADLNAAQILALRTDRKLARRAAEAYTRDNAAYLAAQGHTPTFPNLRLAFLVGAGGAARILSSPPDTRAGTLLGAAVIGANPFMTNLTAGGLIARAARDIEADPKSLAGVTPDPERIFRELFANNSGPVFANLIAPPIARDVASMIQTVATTRAAHQTMAESTRRPKAARPKIEVECDLSKPSCRRWLALAERRIAPKGRRTKAAAVE